jgi:hypothetical protein
VLVYLPLSRLGEIFFPAKKQKRGADTAREYNVNKRTTSIVNARALRFRV